MPRLRKEFIEGLDGGGDGYDVKATGSNKEAVEYKRREVPRIGMVNPAMKKGPDGKPTNEPVGRQWIAEDPKMSQHLALRKQIQGGRVLAPQQKQQYDATESEYKLGSDEWANQTKFADTHKILPREQDNFFNSYRPAYQDKKVMGDLANAARSGNPAAFSQAAEQSMWVKNTPDNPDGRLDPNQNWDDQDAIQQAMSNNPSLFKKLTGALSAGGRAIPQEDYNMTSPTVQKLRGDYNMATMQGNKDMQTKINQALRGVKWNEGQDFEKIVPPGKAGMIDTYQEGKKTTPYFKPESIGYGKQPETTNDLARYKDLKGMNGGQVKEVSERNLGVLANLLDTDIEDFKSGADDATRMRGTNAEMISKVSNRISERPKQIKMKNNNGKVKEDSDQYVGGNNAYVNDVVNKEIDKKKKAGTYHYYK